MKTCWQQRGDNDNRHRTAAIRQSGDEADLHGHFNLGQNTRVCVCVRVRGDREGMLGFYLHKQYLIKPSPDSVLHAVKSLKHHLYISI